MFGLWKHYITEKGEPLGTSQLRSMVDDLLEQSPPPVTSKRRLFSAVSLFLVCCSILGAAGILSTRETSKVDGIILSADETEFVRGLRTRVAAEKVREDQMDRVASQLFKLMDEGSKHAFHARNRQNY